MKYFTNILLNIENKSRKYFEKLPFTHAFLAGVGVILFWRGAWNVADILEIGPITSIIIGCLILGGVGLFVHTFVGNAIIIKQVEREEKVEEKNKEDIAIVGQEIKEEEITLQALSKKLESIETKVNSLME